MSLSENMDSEQYKKFQKEELNKYKNGVDFLPSPLKSFSEFLRELSFKKLVDYTLVPSILIFTLLFSALGSYSVYENTKNLEIAILIYIANLFSFLTISGLIISIWVGFKIFKKQSLIKKIIYGFFLSISIITLSIFIQKISFSKMVQLSKENNNLNFGKFDKLIKRQ